MSRVSQIGKNVVAAIESLDPNILDASNYPSGTFPDEFLATWEAIREKRIPVYRLVAPRDLWAVPARPAIGVCIPSDHPVEGPPGANSEPDIGWKGTQPRRLQVMVAVIANVVASNIASVDALDDIADAVSQFRQLNIGPADQGRVCSHRNPGSISFDLIPHPTRSDPEQAGGGPVIRVDSYLTDVIDL